MAAKVSAQDVARARVVAEPRFSPSGERLGWLAATDGVPVLEIAPADGSAPPTTVGEGIELGSVGAYRGGMWCWVDDEQVALVTKEGGVACVVGPNGPGATVDGDGRRSAPTADGRGRLLFSCSRERSMDVEEASLDGTTSRRWSDADFAWDPATTDDGRFVAWHEWDLDLMSWTQSRVVVVDRHDDVARVVAGGQGVSVGQPRFSPDGAWLAYVSDEGGWWNVVVARADGSEPRPLLAEPCDHAEPAWGPGQRSFAWSPDSDAIALCRNESGFARLVVVSLAGASRELTRGWHHGIDWHVAGIVAVRSGARTPPQVTVVDPSTGAGRVVARSTDVGTEDDAREPSVVTWESDGATVHGLLHPPDRDAERPPMIVDVHGGPTGQATVRWDGWLRFFTSRGWAVLRPNPRGSTGFGRQYIQAGARRWGLDDVDDVAAGIRAAADRGWCDPDRVAIAGGSSGGLTALLLCARHGELVRAAVSAYGVTDLFDLARTTHRFESHYLDEIVGPLPDADAEYRDRSPITHAAAVRVPLLVLQGDNDDVVPKAQADALVAAVRTAGGTVDYRVYEGEGHGWSRQATIADELERTHAFLERWVMR